MDRVDLGQAGTDDLEETAMGTYPLLPYDAETAHRREQLTAAYGARRPRPEPEVRRARAAAPAWLTRLPVRRPAH